MESNNNTQMISMDEIIAESFQRLDIEDSRDELIFRNWIYRALRWVAPCSYSIKTECIKVCDLSIKKPCDYWFGIDMNLIGGGGSVLYYQYAENGFMESEINSSGVGATVGENSAVYGTQSIQLGEDHFCFNLSSNASFANVEKAELKYFALPKDENGDPLIREDIVEAIHAYIQWQYAERGRNRSRGTRKFPWSEVEGLRQRFHNYKGMVQGNIKMPSPQAAEVMLRKWVTLIPDFKNKRRNSRNSRFKTR